MQACKSPTHTIAMSSKLMKLPTSHSKRVFQTFGHRPCPLNGVWGIFHHYWNIGDGFHEKHTKTFFTFVNLWFVLPDLQWRFQFFNDFLFKSIRISHGFGDFQSSTSPDLTGFLGNILQGQKSIHFQRTKLPLRDGGDLALETRHCLLWRGQWWLWSQGSLNGHPSWGIKLDANVKFQGILLNGVLFGLVIIMISVLWVVDRLSWFTLKFNGFFFPQNL